MAKTSPYPIDLQVNRAEGSYLIDKNGRRYLDLIAGVAVNALGHNVKEVNEAITDQLTKHTHVMVYGEYEQSVVSDFAKNLLSFLPPNLDRVYPVNSGTEAIEAAIKLCRRSSYRNEIISFEGAYHGNTLGALSISWSERKKAPFRPLLPGVGFIKLNDFDSLNRISDRTAGVFLETIQGDAGVQIPTMEFMKALRARCDEMGALLVLDEIQCGYGRSGKFAAFEHFGILPDILVMGKALGAGLPIGALISSKKLLSKFETDPMLGHITTFGGNPVIAAAANAGLKILHSQDIIAHVETKGQTFERFFLKIPLVKAFRRMGLMMAVDLGSAELVSQFIEIARKKGVLLFWFLSVPNAFRISPPLTISEEEIEEALNILSSVFEELDVR